MRIILIPLLLLLVVFNAVSMQIALTTASTLNVRNAPAGIVIFTLPKGSTVGVIKSQEDWARIVYLPNNSKTKAKFGWVSAKYLQIIHNLPNKNLHSVSGDDCEWEYETDSQVCVSVTDASIDCRESYDGSYYKGCEVIVEYKVSTDYEGEDFLDVEVECSVEIQYKKRDSYSWNYDSDNDDEDYTLYRLDSELDEMSFDFFFSSYKEVIQVKVYDVECEIDDVYKY